MFSCIPFWGLLSINCLKNLFLLSKEPLIWVYCLKHLFGKYVDVTLIPIPIPVPLQMLSVIPIAL